MEQDPENRVTHRLHSTVDPSRHGAGRAWFPSGQFHRPDFDIMVTGSARRTVWWEPWAKENGALAWNWTRLTVHARTAGLRPLPSACGNLGKKPYAGQVYSVGRVNPFSWKSRL